MKRCEKCKRFHEGYECPWDGRPITPLPEPVATSEEIVCAQRLVSGTPTTGADEALRWLFSEEAMAMTCGQARQAILARWGEAVDAELAARFGGSHTEKLGRWLPLEDAPRDGTSIIGLYDDDEEAAIMWSERPVCMLGLRCGGFPAGWATDGTETDRNLPMDAPKAWRPNDDKMSNCPEKKL